MHQKYKALINRAYLNFYRQNVMKKENNNYGI